MRGREGRERREGVLAGLPSALPGLLLAYRLQERAATVGFDWPDASGPLAKVREELGEVETAVGADRADRADRADKADKADKADQRTLKGGPADNNESTEQTGEPVSPPAPDAVIDEIGDLLFAVVNLARKLRVQPQTAMDRANRKFRSRFEAIERLATQRGIDMATAGLEKLDELWEEAKTGKGRKEKGERRWEER